MRGFVILSIFVASCLAQGGSDYRVSGGVVAVGGGQSRNLVLTEQELRFAGNTLRSVLSGNFHGYQRVGGPRNHRYSGTFIIVENGDRCGDLDIQIQADVRTVSRNGPGRNNMGFVNGYTGQVNY